MIYQKDPGHHRLKIQQSCAKYGITLFYYQTCNNNFDCIDLCLKVLADGVLLNIETAEILKHFYVQKRFEQI